MITYVASGALAVNNTDLSMLVTAPACQAGDILFAQTIAIGASLDQLSLSGTWTMLADLSHGAIRYERLFCKIATAVDSEAQFTASKAVDNNETMGAIISALRGQNSATPLDPATITTRQSGPNQTFVSTNSHDPQGADVHAIFFAWFYNNSTDFTTPPVGTNPTWATRYDVESATGPFSMAMCSGDNDGAAFNPSWTCSLTGNQWASVLLALNATQFVGLDGGTGVLTRRRRR